LRKQFSKLFKAVLSKINRFIQFNYELKKRHGSQLGLFSKSTKKEEKLQDLGETHKFVKALLKQSNKTKKQNENQILSNKMKHFEISCLLFNFFFLFKRL